MWTLKLDHVSANHTLSRMYVLRGKVEHELDRLERDGIIQPMEVSEWAAPIVPVVKTDGSIRICGDYKVTVNQAAKLDTYPLPQGCR